MFIKTALPGVSSCCARKKALEFPAFPPKKFDRVYASDTKLYAHKRNFVLVYKALFRDHNTNILKQLRLLIFAEC